MYYSDGSIYEGESDISPSSTFFVILHTTIHNENLANNYSYASYHIKLYLIVALLKHMKGCSGFIGNQWDKITK